ncbi:Ig-like domain-containing protein [Marinilactibacillus sp. Marseille-P9653]|uniref:Ig-like domain-containing protein n=1 Tax=Marinilactibacillus sp. Marseille-P9653 TaxID=2866583 RepID=UPI001CE49E3C|nr:Ig-like domain-containing protein [Marinilactibacillus sp. Marseille-P9653]
MSYLIKLKHTDSQGVVRIVKFRKIIIIFNFLVILTLLVQFVSPVIAETLNRSDAETEEIQDDESEVLMESEELDTRDKVVDSEVEVEEIEQISNEVEEPTSEQEPEQESEQEAIEENEIFSEGVIEESPISLSRAAAVDAGILNGSTLSVTNTRINNQDRITLTLNGTGVLDLALLRTSTIIFNLPPELMNGIVNRTGRTEIPRLLNLGTQNMNYNANQIGLDTVNDQVFITMSTSLLNLSLGGHYTYTINLFYDRLPLVNNGTYNFSAALVTGGSILDLDLISQNRDTATLQVTNPTVPPLTFTTPIFSTDGTIRGTGVPGYTARITVGGQTFTSVVAANGTFSVDIGAREAGTIIRGIQVRENVLLSSEITTTVIQRPNPPNLLEIYDQDTVVRGTAPPYTTVLLTIGTQSYSGPVGNDGTFAINIQSARAVGTQISAVTINAQQHSSLPGGGIVLASALSLVSVPETMPFGTHNLENVGSLMPLDDSSWAIGVQDTRATGSRWRLDATLAHPLRAGTMQSELPEALVFVDQNNQVTPLSSSALTVFSGTTTSREPVNISWPTNRGPMLQIVPEAMADTYSTTITWTLSDVP